ncbi:hypothetical protein P261_01643 [Lachnospiraceae bacterium TWA4]|nr:hypothetical protein P261_01643 [Lachnospiraceae bacterium TWA4]
MKDIRKLLWGFILIIVGTIWALDAMELIQFSVTTIKGWWTLFIIVPSFIGLFGSNDKKGNLFCLIVGILLFLYCQSVLDVEFISKMAFPIVLVMIGMKFLLDSIFNSKADKDKTDQTDVK